MSAPRDFDRLTEAWLAGLPTEAPDVAVAELLAELRREPQRRSSWVAAAWGWFATPVRSAALLGLVVVLAVVGTLVFTGRLPDAIGQPTTTPASSTAGPTGTASPGAFPTDSGGIGLPPDTLFQSWVRAAPPELAFADVAATGRLTLVFSPTGAGMHVETASGASRHFASTTGRADDELRFASTEAGDPVIVSGARIDGCAPADVGAYTWSLAADGSTLSLSLRADDCPARAAVLAGTWIRYLGAASAGGRGLVDAIEPSFLVTMPTTPTFADPSSGAIEVWAVDSTLGLLVWKDPQGFIDPCDSSAGRDPIAPGGDAMQAYFRRHSAYYAIQSSERVEVGGYPATHLVLDARADASCPSGFFEEWQPAEQVTTLNWHIVPGDRDSLWIVEAPGATVMFEVLPLDPVAELPIVESIEFVPSESSQP